MKTSKLFMSSTIAFLAILVVSCNNDDIDDPVGAITINMLNESNGKIRLGTSEVYIDNANNFCGTSCLIIDLGKRKGLWDLGNLLLNASSYCTAVEPGHGYQVLKSWSIRQFPSGEYAVSIEADYYNAYVLSFIEQNNSSVIIGAKVKYVLVDYIPDHGLPKYNTDLGKLCHSSVSYNSITMQLPVSDFEYEPVISTSSNTLKFDKINNKLIVTAVDSETDDSFGIYIRIKNSYTYVRGEIVRQLR